MKLITRAVAVVLFLCLTSLAVAQTTETEPNNTATAANTIVVGDSVLAAIDPLGDVDYYKFTGTAGDTVVIWGHARNNSELGGRIFLYTSDGLSLATNNGYLDPPYDQRIVWILPASDIYYVRYAQATDWTYFPNRELTERVEAEYWEQVGKDLTTVQWDSAGDYTVGVKKFVPGQPVILGMGAYDFWYNSVRLNGTMSTGATPTTVQFSWGLTTSLDSTRTAPGGPFKTAYPVTIESGQIDSLVSSSFYYYQITATNSFGSAVSGIGMISTPAPPEGWARKKSTASGVKGEFRDVVFLDNNTGVIVGDSVMIRTTNGGTAWTSVYPDTKWRNFRGLFFPSSTVGYAIASYDEVLKTTDAGLTWTTLNTGTSQYLNNAFFLNNLEGWVVTDAGGIARTTDGGATWTIQNSNMTKQLFGVHFMDSNTGVAVGDKHILRTTDGGANWVIIKTDTTTLFRNVSFATPLLGIAVGDDPFIMRTVDGGITWQKITVSTTAMLDLWDIKWYSTTHAIAVGTFGSILRTTDAGLTWTFQSSGTVSDLFSVSIAGDYTNICGRYQAILRSTEYISLQSPNGGEIWAPNSVHNITWLGNLTGNVKLEYRTSSTNPWVSIVASTPGAAGVYAWTVPNVTSTQCMVRITSLNNPAFVDQSAADFSIQVTTEVQHKVKLSAGWNMISSYVDPTDSTLTNMLLSLGAHLSIMKNDEGKFYWPAYSINGIGKWKPLEGYKCYLTAVDSIIVTGEQLAPQSTPIPLASGWSMVAYLRTSPLTAPTALASILTNLVIAKNNAGQVYWPAASQNTIGNLLPGQGYKIYVSAASTLTYPANTTALAKTPESARLTKSLQHFNIAHQLTGNDAILLVKAPCLQENDEVAIYSSTGVSVGAAVAQNGQALITIWGADDLTKPIDGAPQGDQLTLKHWSAAAKTETPLQVIALLDGLTGAALSSELCFRSDAIMVAEVSGVDLLPTEFGLQQNYPNPFNPTTSIRFELPKAARMQLVVYNLRGQAIRTLVDEEKEAGYHDIAWDGRNQAGERVSSGLYMLRMKAGSFSKVIKMSLVK